MHRKVQAPNGKSIMNRLITFLQFIEAAFVEIAIRLVSLLAPVPTAAIVVSRTVEYLHWSAPVAVIAGITVEGFGFASINLVLTLYQYNQVKRQKDPKAPLTLAIAFVAIYIVSAVGLTVLLDTLPELARFAPVIFPAISLCGAGMMILRYNHESRLRAIAEAKAKEKEERKEKKAEQAVMQEPVKSLSVIENLDTTGKVLAFYRDNPLASQAQASQAVDVSRQRIGQILQAAEQTQLIEKRNGHGVIVK